MNPINDQNNKLVRLREVTGLAWLKCQQALKENDDDFDKALQTLHDQESSTAMSKADRPTPEGMIGVAEGSGVVVMVEVNCETDFVARTQEFIQFTDAIAQTILQQSIPSLDQLKTTLLQGTEKTIESARQALVVRTGENINIGRFIVAQNPHTTLFGTYVHRQQIGVIVEIGLLDKELARQFSGINQQATEPLETALEETYSLYCTLAHDIAMHIAAYNPKVISPDTMPESVLEKERKIYLAQANSSGKPKEVIDKMVQASLNKFIEDSSLISQSFVKDADMTVGSLLVKHRMKIIAFHRFGVGETLEVTEVLDNE